jgi:hypothetical protein
MKLVVFWRSAPRKAETSPRDFDHVEAIWDEKRCRLETRKVASGEL